jgi:transcriptional regulator with PAS, ATPase and Fis domain
MNIQTIKQRFGILGNAPSLEYALNTAMQVAPTDLTVLITGESGVGKESFSKIIHQLSARKHNNFIAVNCGAIPEGTINSELFGHTKGSFTGASADRKGYFETCNGGTIFLDEIGEMPLQTQQFLLRVLENKEFMKVGSSLVEITDVRVVAATNVDLMDKIRQGKFREDLYYRLCTVPIRVPPLRERQEDIVLLFKKFAYDFAEKYHTAPVRLDEQAQLIITNYAWNGNIRELKNASEKISVLSAEKMLSAEQLLHIMPEILNRNLPVLSNKNNEQNPGNATGVYEREILFKFLYDMKKDLNDMKMLIAELARTNNLRMPSNIPTQNENGYQENSQFLPMAYPENPNFEHIEKHQKATTVIINSNNNTDNNHPHNNVHFNPTEEIEEPLSINDMEKDMILKALKKHKGRRKDAAKELGISERTLYRKISDYGIDNS